MKRLLLLLFSITISASAHSQGNPSKAKPKEKIGDVSPHFPGGIEKFFKYIRQNKMYPAQAKKNKVQGKVFVSFVLDSTGHVREKSVKVIKGLGHGCDKEAVRLIKNSPPWIPGQMSQTRENASIRMILPIAFKQ